MFVCLILGGIFDIRIILFINCRLSSQRQGSGSIINRDNFPEQN